MDWSGVKLSGLMYSVWIWLNTKAPAPKPICTRPVTKPFLAGSHCKTRCTLNPLTVAVFLCLIRASVECRIQDFFTLSCHLISRQECQQCARIFPFYHGDQHFGGRKSCSVWGKSTSIHKLHQTLTRTAGEETIADINGSPETPGADILSVIYMSPAGLLADHTLEGLAAAACEWSWHSFGHCKISFHHSAEHRRINEMFLRTAQNTSQINKQAE